MYALIKSFLFSMQPEKAHHFTTGFLHKVLAIPGMKSLFRSMYVVEDKRLEREVFGLKFKNPVGLAAGFDKNATLYNDFQYLGFGFIEIGTVTPKGQPGNPQPRMFRLVSDEALINRMGFNNEGVEEAISQLKKKNTDLIIGGNIGKNKVTPNDQAVNDYELCFEALFPYVDYFVVNVSSPNTPNLRELQDKEPLTQLLTHLQKLNEQKEQTKPILLKIAPDLTDSQLDDIIAIVQDAGIAGVIATNTTISRENLSSPEKLKSEMGGLSGKPLKERSTEVIRYLHTKSNGAFPIIGVGGIQSADDAVEKLEAGASLIQVYTGFIYQGPSLLKEINQRLLQS